jgi:signal transduction histidine kinase
MIGILDVLLGSGLPPEQSEQVTQVKDCAVHQLSLLNEILDISKVGHGYFWTSEQGLESLLMCL